MWKLTDFLQIWIVELLFQIVIYRKTPFRRARFSLIPLCGTQNVQLQLLTTGRHNASICDGVLLCKLQSHTNLSAEMKWAYYHCLGCSIFCLTLGRPWITLSSMLILHKVRLYVKTRGVRKVNFLVPHTLFLSAAWDNSDAELMPEGPMTNNFDKSVCPKHPAPRAKCKTKSRWPRDKK